MSNGKVTLFPAFEQSNVPVVIAADNLYAPYAGVFIQSLLDHASKENNYDIIILQRDISEENKRLLKHLGSGHTNVSIRFCDPSPLFVSFNYKEEEQPWPLEVFYKSVAPHILNYPGRIIVADIDTLLKTDIARVMDEDLEGCCVGGVSNAPVLYASCLLDHTVHSSVWKIQARDYFPNVYGFEDWKDYKSYKNNINAGLLLFDCQKYIQELDVETMIHTAQSNTLLTQECVLNILMRGKTKLLDLAWNVRMLTNRRTSKVLDVIPKIYDEIYNENGAFQRSYEEPYMLHWVSKPKPWVCPDVSHGSEWWQTALRTPFVGHIIARMTDAQETRRAYYRKRYGKEDVNVWEPSPKVSDRT